MTIKELIERAHNTAVKHGFWEDWGMIQKVKKIVPDKTILHHEKMTIGNMLMLIVSEMGEAEEALRHDNIDNFKEELADVAIRLADLCGGLEIDLEKEIEKKMAINEKRPYKHGKQF